MQSSLSILLIPSDKGLSGLVISGQYNMMTTQLSRNRPIYASVEGPSIPENEYHKSDIFIVFTDFHRPK